MKCKKCGFEFDEGIFCPECGTKVEMELNLEEHNQEAIAEHEVLLEKQKAELEQIARERAEQEKAQQEKVAKAVEDEGKTMSILSLVFGIIALVSCGCWFVPEILGIIFAYLGKKQGKMRGMAKTGLICSIISIAIMAIILIWGLSL